MGSWMVVVCVCFLRNSMPFVKRMIGGHSGAGAGAIAGISVLYHLYGLSIAWKCS